MPEATLNGVRIHYETQGHGPALVLLHGMTLDHREWAEQVAAFSDRYRVITYDQRGHGRSESPGEYGVEPDAADLEALLDELGAPWAHLVGLSRGAAIAVAFALRSPTRVRSLVLADPYIAGHLFAVPLTDPPFWRVARAEGAAAARRVWLTAEAMRAVRDPALKPRIAAMVEAFSTDMWLKGGKEPDHLARLAEITAPTLALVAERDPQDFWDVADLVVARIPGARRVLIPDSGHLSNMENPEAFNAAVGEFLDAVTAAQPG